MFFGSLWDQITGLILSFLSLDFYQMTEWTTNIPFSPPPLTTTKEPFGKILGLHHHHLLPQRNRSARYWVPATTTYYRVLSGRWKSKKGPPTGHDAGPLTTEPPLFLLENKSMWFFSSVENLIPSRIEISVVFWRNQMLNKRQVSFLVLLRWFQVKIWMFRMERKCFWSNGNRDGWRKRNYLMESMKDGSRGRKASDW